jgi:hypothetical protein
MRIEKYPHDIYSSKSFKCSSSSSRIVNRPFALPAFRGCRLVISNFTP